MSKFDELKKAAEALPELPWEVTGHTVYALEHDSWRKGVEQMRNRFSFSVQRGPDTPESELQAVAEFCKAANPAALLDLLAIQAQLVEALKLFTDFPPDVLTMPANENYTFSVQGWYFAKACAALAAAGAKP